MIEEYCVALQHIHFLTWPTTWTFQQGRSLGGGPRRSCTPAACRSVYGPTCFSPDWRCAGSGASWCHDALPLPAGGVNECYSPKGRIATNFIGALSPPTVLCLCGIEYLSAPNKLLHILVPYSLNTHMHIDLPFNITCFGFFEYSHLSLKAWSKINK